VKIRADLEVTCFGYDGIDAIKEALKAGEAFSSKEMPIKIKLVAPPLYVMMASSLHKERGILTLVEACERITAVVRSKGGDVNIKAAARAVTAADELQLAAEMETFEKQNAEVAGDEPTDD